MKPRKLCLAANWKMNQSIHNLESYKSSLKKLCQPSLEAITDTMDVVLAVPSLFLVKAHEVFSPCHIQVSAQNTHWENSGAFTGELSCTMLKESQINTCVIGHSERRTLFKESNQEVHLKFNKALKENITPILCVGENLEERKQEKTFAVLKEQLSSCVTKDVGNQKFMIAYEPVWAIGTGLTATKDQAHEAHLFIRNWLAQNLSSETSEQTRVLYGGSMNPKVTEKLLSSSEIDGGLVGGASLDPEKFSTMLNLAYKSLKN